MADYFWQEAQARRAVEQVILETFRRWGYGDVIPPMFEYADVLEQHNVGLRAAMYRFLDRDDSTLTLRGRRCILSPPGGHTAARLAHAPALLLRGSVFRYLELEPDASVSSSRRALGSSASPRPRPTPRCSP
ncbi:MAG: ATP phosphoribosyltransferase regulatory subunit [Caldilineaceae bacterium]